MRFDEKNKLLIEHLFAHARFQVKDLAKALKTTQASVIRRIQFLEENDYISRYDAIVDWQNVDLIKKVYFVAVEKNNIDFESEVKKHKPVFSIFRLAGFHTHQIWCFFKSQQQVSEFESYLANYPYESINVIKHIVPKTSYFNMTLKLPIPKPSRKPFTIDEIDVKIMKQLANNHARDSLRKISIDLGINYDKVHHRGRKILQTGLFQAFIAQPGSSFSNVQMTNLVIKCSSNEQAKKLFDKLLKTRRVSGQTLGKNSIVFSLFLSMGYVEYKQNLLEILSLIPREEIKNVSISHWDGIVMNNRYPFEFLISKNE
jgi:DNA-binding Lrp family transcriptional regulator